MKKERITSYLLSERISNKDLENISAASGTISPTYQATYTNQVGDAVFDLEKDSV